MRRTNDMVTWIFAAGASASLLLLAYAFATGQGRYVAQNGFDLNFIVGGCMAATLIFGLFIALPQWRRSQAVRAGLAHRTAELEVAVVTDPLTGLYNRRYFDEALSEYLSEFLRIGAPLAVLTLDLDHFKGVNDTYGHDAGDIVLRDLSETLRGLTREHDIIARTGGEEFCIVAPFAQPEQVRPFAERICRAVSEMRVDVGAVIIRPSVSIGVASTAEGLTRPAELVKMSDDRLYEAKEMGRNRVVA